MTDSSDAAGAPPTASVYAYKPSLMGAAWELALTDAGLAWSYGRHAGVVPYGSITKVRLSFRPVSMQSHRFLAEVWSPVAPKIPIVSSSWRSMTDQSRQDGAYRDFVVALHGRMEAAGAQARLVAGMHPVLFWTGAAVSAMATLGLAGLVVRSLQVGEPAGAAVVGAVLALFGWSIGNFFRRNRPGTYRTDALPAALLPG